MTSAVKAPRWRRVVFTAGRIAGCLYLAYGAVYVAVLAGTLLGWAIGRGLAW